MSTAEEGGWGRMVLSGASYARIVEADPLQPLWSRLTP